MCRAHFGGPHRLPEDLRRGDGAAQRLLRDAVGVQQGQRRALALRFGQRAQGRFESRDPLGVVVDAGDRCSLVDEPVNDDVQRDAVVVRVHHVVGPEAVKAVAADGGDGLGDEISRKAVVMCPWPLTRYVLSVEGARRDSGRQHADQQAGERIRHVELTSEPAVRQDQIGSEHADRQPAQVVRLAKQHLSGPLAIGVAVGIPVVDRPMCADFSDVAVFDEVGHPHGHSDRRQVGHRLEPLADRQANHLPVTVVSNLVGLPEKGRERMLIWADEMFNCFGPINDRNSASFFVLDEMMHYATNEAVPDKLKPGGWAMGIHDAVARGEVPAQACPAMMIDYLGPSLDTTIFAITNAVWLFAKYPDQWDMVREDPRLIPSAINEVLRYDAPIRGFSRYVARDVDMDGVLLPAGSRAIVFYGAANRDERKYPHPDRFDVLRRPGDHLGFGAGPHACVGMNLARIEMMALFTELAKRVRRFTIEEEKRILNNVLRGFTTLRITVS